MGWVFCQWSVRFFRKKISSSNYISFESAWQGELKKSHAILLIFKMSNFSEKHDWEKRYIKWKRSRCKKNLDISHFTHFWNLKIYWSLTKKRPLWAIKIWRPFRESVREIKDLLSNQFPLPGINKEDSALGPKNFLFVTKY